MWPGSRPRPMESAPLPWDSFEKRSIVSSAQVQPNFRERKSKKRGEAPTFYYLLLTEVALN